MAWASLWMYDDIEAWSSSTSWEPYTLVSSLLGLKAFFVLVLGVVVTNAKTLFFSRHGWSHRVAGSALLIWLVYGVIQIALIMATTATSSDKNNMADSSSAIALQWLFYDTVLGFLGITTTLTAARDFPHKYVQNAKGQSGSLSNKALVTQAEMVEHSFYQALNLLQAWYLHFVSSPSSYGQKQQQQDWKQWLALFLVTSPWYVRQHFPVHSFSHNWSITPEHQRTTQEVMLYRIKKAQYLFYKHVLLHGINISMALQQSTSITSFPNDKDNHLFFYITATPAWRIYWLALNTSYVMEFFLQTMVRRNILSVSSMFALQRLLIAASSIAAMMILFQKQMVQTSVCIVSLALNFVHRRHDVSNVLLTAAIFYYFQTQEK